MADPQNPSHRTKSGETPASRFAGSPAGRVLRGGLRAVATAWGTMFVLAFLAGGLFFGSVAVRSYLSGGMSLAGLAAAGGAALLCLFVPGRFALVWWRERKEAAHDYAEPPGAYRRVWRSRRIRATGVPGSRKSWARMAVGALVPGAATVLGAYFIIWPMLEKGETSTALLFVLLSGLIWGTALYFLYQLYQAVRHRLRYGRAAFVMDPWPARLGGSLSGTVETGVSDGDRSADGFHAALTCCKRTKGGRGSRYRYRVLWEAQQQVHGRPRTGDGGGVDVPVSFDLPDDPPPSTLERKADSILWYVDISADTGGPSYTQRIEIPVFTTERRAARPGEATPAAPDAARNEK